MGIPAEVLSQSPFNNCLPALRAHLADLSDDPEPLSDVKLMVLGNGRIGKSQICNRLRGEPYEHEADSTHGIMTLPAPIPENMGRFNVWDFGGQDIYHGTHGRCFQVSFYKVHTCAVVIKGAPHPAEANMASREIH